MAATRRAGLADQAGAMPGISAATAAELASYIEEMTQEMEIIARRVGLERLGELLRQARDEARCAATHHTNLHGF